MENDIKKEKKFEVGTIKRIKILRIHVTQYAVPGHYNELKLTFR